MFDARRLAAIPAGRRTKWVVLLAWVAIAAVAFPLGGRLTSVQRNDAASYLPRNAESTRVNRQLAGFPDSGSLAAVVVYRRETGLTAADRARAAADREELRRHADKHDAMAEALRGAGPAIVASGTTVTLGLLCLLAAQLNSLRGLGPVGAAGIVCALAAMLTLLVILGRRVFWPFVPRVGAAHTEEAGVWGRVGRAIRGRPRPVWALTALALAVMALGLAGAEVGLGQDQQFRTTPDAVVGQRLLRASFPPGAADPTIVTARAESAAAVLRAVRTTEGVAEARPAGQAGGLTRIAATLRAEPGEAASRGTVDRLRERVHAVPGAGALVGGAAAIDLDVARTSSRDQAVVIPLVLAVVLAILALLLRALSAPLLLVATVIVSFAAALGASAVVFDRLFGFPALDVSVPLYSFVFLVALGIDYNIFLMTRVREESRRAGTRAGTLRGLAVTGGVITSAGIVLAATFAVLGVLPLVLLTQIGFVVAFGVLLDTLIVRSVLVPALAFDLDRRIWWPSRLAAPRQPAPSAPVQPAHSAPRR
jgi:putative drug exporter of the RND superfamily